MNIRFLTVLTCVCALCCALAAAAATITNYAPSPDGDWSNPANWIGGAAPANGDIVVLHIMPGLLAPTNVDIANLTLTTLAFSNVLSGGVNAGVRIVGRPLKIGRAHV